MQQPIAVGGGRPPIRFKTSKNQANSLCIWANSLFIWAHHWQKIVSVSVKNFFFWRTPQFGQKNRSNVSEDLFFFFFFRFEEHLNLDRKTVQILVKTFFIFLENTLIWAEKNVSILTEKHNASSYFSGKSLVPPQIILSFYDHATAYVMWSNIYFSLVVTKIA